MLSQMKFSTSDSNSAFSLPALTFFVCVAEPQDGIQPWFISKPQSVRAVVGQNVIISCAIAGDPFPTVHWFKDGEEITTEAGYEFLQNEDIFTLIIRNIEPCQAGQYEIQLR